MRIKLWHIGVLSAVAVLFGCAKPHAPSAASVEVSPVVHTTSPRAADRSSSDMIGATSAYHGRMANAAHQLSRLPVPGFDGGPILPGLLTHHPQPPRPPKPVDLPLFVSNALPPNAAPLQEATAPVLPDLPALPLQP